MYQLCSRIPEDLIDIQVVVLVKLNGGTSVFVVYVHVQAGSNFMGGNDKLFSFIGYYMRPIFLTKIKCYR